MSDTGTMQPLAARAMAGPPTAQPTAALTRPLSPLSPSAIAAEAAALVLGPLSPPPHGLAGTPTVRQPRTASATDALSAAFAAQATLAAPTGAPAAGIGASASATQQAVAPRGTNKRHKGGDVAPPYVGMLATAATAAHVQQPLPPAVGVYPGEADPYLRQTGMPVVTGGFGYLGDAAGRSEPGRGLGGPAAAPQPYQPALGAYVPPHATFGGHAPERNGGHMPVPHPAGLPSATGSPPLPPLAALATGTAFPYQQHAAGAAQYRGLSAHHMPAYGPVPYHHQQQQPPQPFQHHPQYLGPRYDIMTLAERRQLKSVLGHIPPPGLTHGASIAAHGAGAGMHGGHGFGGGGHMPGAYHTPAMPVPSAWATPPPAGAIPGGGHHHTYHPYPPAHFQPQQPPFSAGPPRHSGDGASVGGESTGSDTSAHREHAAPESASSAMSTPPRAPSAQDTSARTPPSAAMTTAHIHVTAPSTPDRSGSAATGALAHMPLPPAGKPANGNGGPGLAIRHPPSAPPMGARGAISSFVPLSPFPVATGSSHEIGRGIDFGTPRSGISTSSAGGTGGITGATPRHRFPSMLAANGSVPPVMMHGMHGGGPSSFPAVGATAGSAGYARIVPPIGVSTATASGASDETTIASASAEGSPMPRGEAWPASATAAAGMAAAPGTARSPLGVELEEPPSSRRMTGAAAPGISYPLVRGTAADSGGGVSAAGAQGVQLSAKAPAWSPAPPAYASQYPHQQPVPPAASTMWSTSSGLATGLPMWESSPGSASVATAGTRPWNPTAVGASQGPQATAAAATAAMAPLMSTFGTTPGDMHGRPAEPPAAASMQPADVAAAAATIVAALQQQQQAQTGTAGGSYPPAFLSSGGAGGSLPPELEAFLLSAVAAASTSPGSYSPSYDAGATGGFPVTGGTAQVGHGGQRRGGEGRRRRGSGVGGGGGGGGGAGGASAASAASGGIGVQAAADHHAAPFIGYATTLAATGGGAGGGTTTGTAFDGAAGPAASAGAGVPARQQSPVVDIDQILRGAESRTTLMLKNLPNRLTAGALVDYLDRSGLQGTYDFVYLPIDLGTGGNVGCE